MVGNSWSGVRKTLVGEVTKQDDAFATWALGIFYLACFDFLPEVGLYKLREWISIVGYLFFFLDALTIMWPTIFQLYSNRKAICIQWELDFRLCILSFLGLAVWLSALPRSWSAAVSCSSVNPAVSADIPHCTALLNYSPKLHVSDTFQLNLFTSLPSPPSFQLVIM